MVQKCIRSTLQQVDEATIRHVGNKKGRSLRITGAACLGSFLVGLGKLALGIFTMSLLTCASAFYTFGMVMIVRIIRI